MKSPRKHCISALQSQTSLNTNICKEKNNEVFKNNYTTCNNNNIQESHMHF